MEYRRLPLACECGGEPKSISAVGFSSQRELVVHWRCPRCRKNLCVVMPLSDCWRECFPGAAGNTSKSKDAPNIETPDDRRFLHSIGVRFHDDEP